MKLIGGIMEEIMGIIFANDDDARLGELTFHRATASLPFAGRYRLIDFALSNFVNSGITKVGIITKLNYSSLMDHIRMGRDWDLNRKNSGIAVFPPFVSNNSRNMYKGKIDALEGIKDYFERAREEYVLIVNGNVVANIDYIDMFNHHIKNNADVTILTYKTNLLSSRNIIISKKTKTKIKEVLIENKNSNTMVDEIEMSLNSYLLKKDLLIEIINKAYSQGYIDFERVLLQDGINKYNIHSYLINGFVSVINNIDSYYQASMSLLDKSKTEDLFYKHGKIFTKVKDSVPVYYGEKSEVKNSLIADGCKIEGKVENSILFRGVVVEKGAYIKNSIIMEHTKIAQGANIQNIIADKDVDIKDNVVLSGHSTYPLVLAKGRKI